MAILKPDSDDETPNFFLEKDDDNKKNLDFHEESEVINSSEPLTDPTIKKNPEKTRYVHMPSVGLGAGIAIGCLVLGIFLPVNFIDEEKIVEETPTVKIIPASKDMVGNPPTIENTEKQKTDIYNYCSNCGQKNSIQAKFCPSCGTNLQS